MHGRCLDDERGHGGRCHSRSCRSWSGYAMTIKVAYITTARSDYGPSYWLIHDLFADNRFETVLGVGGSHLSRRHGYTVQEIEKDGWPIATRMPFLEEEDGDVFHGRAAGRAVTVFSEFFAKVHGDRYEHLAIALAAIVTRTPLAHISGGDVTEGAIDDQVRHAITKTAHLHFPSTKQSAERIQQMGEEAWRIHPVGEPALDHFVRGKYASADELARVLGFMPGHDTLLVTFHPVTLELEDMARQVRELTGTLREYAGHVIITSPAPDPGGTLIRNELEVLANSCNRILFIESLGSYQYRGLLRLVGALVGNSSSGLVEAPSIPLPVVNIGRRQEGRQKAANVIEVPAEKAALLQGIEQALSPAFRDSLSGLKNPYGDGHSAQRIVSVLASLPDRASLIRKRFCSP